jgi:MSHA pilin protein MshD
MIFRPERQAGVTLLELIVSMVIISISIVGLFTVVNLTLSHSADPVVNYQAVAIAESYMEEILLQAYADPDGTDLGEVRSIYDDVSDYDGLVDAGAHNQEGVLLTSLTRYRVAVGVSAPTPLYDGVLAKKVTVTVSSQGFPDLTLVGYKVDY